MSMHRINLNISLYAHIDAFVAQEGFLIGAHHGLELSDVDRVCALLVEPLARALGAWGDLSKGPKELQHWGHILCYYIRL